MTEKGGSLNKKFVAIFVFFGLFATLLATMPSQYASMGMNASVQNKEAVDFFSSQNVTVYNNTIVINLTYCTPEQRDWGLPPPELIEFWWCFGIKEFGSYGVTFQVRHLRRELLGYWYGWHRLKVQEPYRSRMELPSFPQLMRENDVVNNFWDENSNASYVELAGNIVTMKIFITPTFQNETLQESWDRNRFTVYSTYNIDWGETSTGAWGILMQLLTFQNPELGIPGSFGLILSTLISLTLWGSIGLIAFAMITALVPFVSGWGGD